MAFSIQGKTAIITGAGSGINLAFAALLLAGGCNVVIGDLALRPEAQKLVDEHSELGKPKAVFVKTDVTIWDDLNRLFDTADNLFGDLDIVCPGAGVFEPHWTNFWHPPGSAESRDAVTGNPGGVGHYALLDINLVHPIRMTQLAISRWLNPASESRAGRVSIDYPKRVIHISSIAAQTPNFTAPMYAASKAGLSGFIRSVSHLERIGIRVNGVAPGVIKTPLWTEHPEKLKLLNTETIEWVEPEEVANAMVRCCVEDSLSGGTVLEVLKGKTRCVDWRNDPGPVVPTAVNAEATHDEIFSLLDSPGWGTTK